MMILHENGQVHDYCTTQVNMNRYFSTDEYVRLWNIATSIPAQDIYENPQDDSFGLEHQYHCTIYYGLTNDNAFLSLDSELSNYGVVTAKIGKINAFRGTNDNYDVLKIEVISPQLQGLHDKVGDCCNHKEDSFPEYVPHITVAYIKPGTCKGYEGPCFLTGRVLTIDYIWFINRQGESYPIYLV